METVVYRKTVTTKQDGSTETEYYIHPGVYIVIVVALLALVAIL
jgi:hypothetical protein